ncbi:hypothetical protein ISF_07180 [Cordyceps fumosorosea ARSEF 2679]|uniref:Uncharacterized protein n=1 Tax=Cordyceps fumosorosea (strain ARSEF 2679) TaxID=1081104 RepID=A0A167Q3Y9_CORFA|nr:hypothetical protein ISF_07180 [Cordyceps fumosorosea ARSEF 2679]OAA57259.1 hypothetical protein ISF_07180 [Cordyceps fumosorosea ARSEF 2679]
MPPSPLLQRALAITARDAGLDRAMERLGGGGPVARSVVRGFFVGVGLGLMLALLCCCWHPCFGEDLLERPASPAGGYVGEDENGIVRRIIPEEERRRGRGWWNRPARPQRS